LRFTSDRREIPAASRFDLAVALAKPLILAPSRLAIEEHGPLLKSQPPPTHELLRQNSCRSTLII
jgi:hypothetical protein